MAWLKVSDTAAMHPVVLAPIADPADDGLDPFDRVNVLCGMVVRCATLSAGYLTDYIVSDATVAQVAGSRWRERAAAAERAGYWTRVDAGWLILDDSTNFVHIRKADEIEWERQRKKDTATPSLVVPVRLRDGDGCRYCGRIVTWGDQRGGRGGTYDHRTPGAAAAGPDDLRVACRSCNSRRGNDPDADQRVPPLPVPAQPHYGERTRALLAEHGYVVPQAPARPGDQPDTAPRDLVDDQTPRSAIPPSAGHRAATRQPAGPREGKSEDQLPESVDPANPRSTPPGTPGRDGAGRDGQGRQAFASAPSSSPPPPTRRRGRRGRRHL